MQTWARLKGHGAVQPSCWPPENLKQIHWPSVVVMNMPRLSRRGCPFSVAFGGGDDAVGRAWVPSDTGVGGVGGGGGAGSGGGAGGGGHTTASTAGAESFSSTVTPRSLERTLRLRLATSPTSVLTSSLVVWTRKVTAPPLPWSRVTVAVEATSAPAWRFIRFTNACTSAAFSAGECPRPPRTRSCWRRWRTLTGQRARSTAVRSTQARRRGARLSLAAQRPD